MLLVALSCLICCSRVWRDNRRHRLLFESLYIRLFLDTDKTDIFWYCFLLPRNSDYSTRQVSFEFVVCSQKCRFKSIINDILITVLLRMAVLKVIKVLPCGPPKPSGTPNLCAFPNAISAPISFGVFNKHSASKSVAQTAIVFKILFI